MTGNSLADIGLLVALPLDRAEFEEHVYRSDWLGKFLCPDVPPLAQQAAIDERWIEDYAPLIASPLHDVMDFARSGGAAVWTRASLQDVAVATATKRVVILFAHWKGPEIVFDDLATPWNFESFVSHTHASTSPLARWLTIQFRNNRRDRTGDVLLDVLNAALDVPLTEPGIDGVPVLEHSVTRRARRRRELEELWPGCLRPGNRLELFNGLFAKDQVEAQIAPDFTGVLDLASCTSSVLADYIASRRGHRVRTVQFPMVLEILWAAKAIAGTLQLFGTGNFQYLEARQRATEQLNLALRDALKESK